VIAISSDVSIDCRKTLLCGAHIAHFTVPLLNSEPNGGSHRERVLNNSYMQRTPIIIYALLGLGVCGSVVIAYEAITLPFLRGAALAQADFELFVLSLLLGMPVAIVSVAVLTWVYKNRLSVKSKSMLFRDWLALLGAVNIAIVLIGLTMSLAIRKYGFFWL
jgi:hypothetical protein